MRKRFVSLWNQKTISCIFVVLLAVVVGMMFGSRYYLNQCIEKESLAQKNRYELQNLGQSLADASDYLTDEVRKSAISGDLTHFYNYWYEVEEAKNRDRVVEEMESYDLPDEEKELLAKAKEHSDQLIQTEICSMKLILLYYGIDIEEYRNDPKMYSYLRQTMDFQLPEEYRTRTGEELYRTAVELLYDDHYTGSKENILSPIEEFQETTDKRLSAEVEAATAGRKHATVIQTISLVVAAFLLLILLWSISHFYVKPLKAYAESFREVKSEEGNIDFASLTVRPSGAYELYRLGEHFNDLVRQFDAALEESQRAESAMREARDRADRANDAKSEFLAQMSHELRTPLNAIIGYLDLLQDTLLDENQLRYFRNLQVSAQNLLELISDILDFSKIESGNMPFERTAFHLKDCVKEIYQVMEVTAQQKKLGYYLSVDPALPEMAYGDEMKLKQILNNLLGNAFKFTKRGSVSLKVCMVEESHRHFVAEFTVQDTGVGIAKKDQEKIFQPFVQSDAGVTRKYGGTGLGLSISKKIVEEASAGLYTLNLTSQPLKGSCFTFCIRFKKVEEAQSSGMGNQLAELHFDEARDVLLVDDNEINLYMEQEIIQKTGLAVTTAASGPEAIRLCQEHRYDLIFMDIRMPGMDGYETASQIKSNRDYEKIPIIALTADVVSGVEEKVRKAGMCGYLTKPIRKPNLYHVLNRHAYRLFRKEECLDLLDGDVDTLRFLVERFLSRQEASVPQLTEYALAGKYKEAREVMHDMLGLSGNLCLEQFHAAAKNLQKNLRNESVEGLEQFLTVWNDTSRELIVFLEKG